MSCKSILHDFADKISKDQATYYSDASQGPPHDRIFYSDALFDGIHYTGRARTKKEAEQRAAYAAIKYISGNLLFNYP
jgi:dsRNA-specific ribonuclease